MRAGHGTALLPVPDGTPMGGYAARTSPSAGVLAPLQVDCVSIATGSDRFLLVVAELVGVNADLAAAVRQRVGGEVWVCATHTHSGPDVGSRAGGGVTPPAWVSAVADAAAEAARLAVANETECIASHHDGELVDVGSRRDADTGDRHVPVDVLRFGPADRPIGVLAVVPVHPTVLPASSSVVSGDLTAWIRSALRDRLGPAPWIVVATGAAGDISTRWTRRAQTEADGRRLAGLAADQVAALLAAGPGRTWTADDGIATARRTLTLPAREDDRDRLDGLRAAFAEQLARTAPGDPAGRAAVTALQGVEAAAARAHDGTAAAAVTPEAVALELAAARFGGLTLHGIGGEPFLSLRAAVAPSVLLGYANGYAGYLPAADDFDTPAYEVLISPFRPDAAAQVAGALHELAHRTTHGG
jgi:neutral ceramidase